MATDSWSTWDDYSSAYGPSAAQEHAATESMEDDRYLETIPEVDSIRSKRSSTYTFSSDRNSRAIPQAVQRLSRPHNLDPAWVPSARSSMYEPVQAESRRSSYVDISPPSTPRKSWGGSLDEAPISPIEPIPPVPTLFSRTPLPEQRSKMQIPRKVPVPRSANKEPTKWDKYSGERTTDSSGVVSAVRPGAVPLEEQFELKERTRQILANLRARDQAKKSPTFQTATFEKAPEQPVQREPWKGQSGRSAIVDPLVDTPSAHKTTLSRPAVTIERKEIGSAQTTESVTTQPVPQMIRPVQSQEDLQPIAPLRVNKGHTPSPPTTSAGPPRSATFPLEPDHTLEDPGLSPSPPQSADAIMLQSPFHSPQPPRLPIEEPLPLSSTRTESPQYETSPETPRTPSPEEYQAVASIPQTSTHPMEPEVSRFSWTTYATSVTDSPSSSARIMRSESPPPPMPPMPAILKRPMTSAGALESDPNTARAQGAIIMRKPVPVPSLSIPSPPSGRGKKKSGDLSRTKTLPRIPPELEAADKISGLEARIGVLSRRKYNLNRIISNLKKDLEKNRVNYDMYKRKEVEGRIDGYEKELQSAMSDEHQIGLMLHRAVKKRDKDDGYELPTGLWIRRVTS